MKRILLFALTLCILLSVIPCVNAAPLNVNAEAAVLYCGDNNEVYYSKNENKRMKQASTTKIMTALLVLEYAEKNNKKVKFTKDMIAEGSSMYLKLGEVVTLRDLAVGILMCSGNDAANAAAIAIDGSKEKFASRMNRRAKQLGMTGTNFVTPSGLDDDNHYSTARDMAALMRAALKNSALQSLTAKKSETVSFISPKGKVCTYSNHNRLLSMYKYCIGGKTGYTMAAGRCLVTAAKKDGLTLIAVTLNDRNDWNDHVSMYNYGFENYRMKTLDDTDFYLDIHTVGGEREKITACSEGVSGVVLTTENSKRVKRVVFADNFIYAPVKSGDKVGEIAYYLDETQLARHDLFAADDNNTK